MAKLRRSKPKSNPNLGNRIFKFSGSYHGASINGNVLKPFDIELLMSPKMYNNPETSALSVFKNLGQDAMREKYRDFVAFYEIHIIGSEAENEEDEIESFSELELSNLSLIELRGLVEDEELDIDLDLYADAGALRDAIALYNESPDIYFKHEEDLRARDKGAIKMKSELDALNPVDKNAVPLVPIVPGTETPPAPAPAPEAVSPMAAVASAKKGKSKDKESVLGDL